MRHAFTLIELLVVITVIAVLAGMLLPAVNLVRASAKTATCAASLRQFQLANEAYATDWDGSYVSICSTGSGENLGWYASATFRAYLLPEGGAYPKGLLCPESWGAAHMDAVNPLQRSYGMNTTNYGPTPPTGVVVRLDDAGNHGANLPCRFLRSAVQRPGDKIAIADALDWWVNEYISNVYTAELNPPPYKMIAYRHRSGVNIAFYDGHVERRARNQIDTSLNATAAAQTWAVIRP